MAETLVNKTQTGEGIWTSDNLVAGNNISITEVQKPVIDSNTVELLHFNDDAIDSISNETLTRQIPTYSIGKFDKAAQNPTNYTIAFNTPVSFTKGNSYYTIDCWISSNASGDYNRKLKLLSSVSLDCINFGTNSVEIYRAFNNGSQDITVNYPNNITLEVGVWHHFALVGNGTQTLMFFDGKLFYSTSYTEGNEPIAFYGFTGRMDVDELRVSNVARWTSDFTPYTEPYGPAGGPTEYKINNTQDISGKLDTSVAEETFAKKTDVKEYTAGDNISIVQVEREELTVSGFSNANYILLPGSVFATRQMPWELIIKAKVPSTATTSQNLLFGPVYTPGQSIGLGINLDVTSDHELKGRFGLSSSGDSWNLRAWTEYGSALQFDTWYWLKLSWNGTTYKFQTSTNGEQYSDYLTQLSRMSIYFTASNDVQLGNRGSSANYPFNGYIDIRGCYISINRQTTFNGEIARENSDYYLVGDLNITEQTLFKYKINNTQDISGKQNTLTTATGYDATKTQVLKNVNGTLTWVDEA